MTHYPVSGQMKKLTTFEKACKGISQCTLSDKSDEYETQCTDCPYYEPGITVAECTSELRDDVLSLLKSRIVTIEVPFNAKVSVSCDGKRYSYDRYRPGHWNGLNGGMMYGQYFDMEDENRVREMTEVASALSKHGIRYDLQKLKRQYRITISKKDYFDMEDALRKRIYEINCYHDRTV